MIFPVFVSPFCLLLFFSLAHFINLLFVSPFFLVFAYVRHLMLISDLDIDRKDKEEKIGRTITGVGHNMAAADGLLLIREKQ